MFNHNSATSTLLTGADWAMRIDMPVEAYEYTGSGPGATYNLSAIEAATGTAEWIPTLPAELTPISTEALRGSDVLVLRFLSAESVGLDGLGVNAGVVDALVSDPAWTAFSPYVEAGRMYAVTNCQLLSLFQANAGANAGGQFNALVGGANQSDWNGNEVYGSSGSRLYRYEIAVYYVALMLEASPRSLSGIS